MRQSSVNLAGSQYSEAVSNPVRSAGITPLSLKSAWRAVPWIAAAIVVLVCCSCGSTKSINHEPLTINHQDTIYLNKVQYDSVFYSVDHYIDRTSDTIYVKDVSVQYKYKLLRDTLRIHEVDSIPIIKEVEITKEVRYVPWWSKALSSLGCIVLIIFCLSLAKKLFLP